MDTDASGERPPDRAVPPALLQLAAILAEIASSPRTDGEGLHVDVHKSSVPSPTRSASILQRETH